MTPALARMLLPKAALAALFIASSAGANAQSLCTPAEKDVFSCRLKRTGKIVSFCASPAEGPATYLQYRFGTDRKVELTIPPRKSGWPAADLTRSADATATYDQFSVTLGDFTYDFSSFRRLAPKNRDGLPTPESSDTLTVRDDRRSMRQGDAVFIDDCARLGAPLDVRDIGARTGLQIQRGGF